MRSRFSLRTGWNLSETRYAAAVRMARVEAARTGRRLYDLTASNPTTCGFHYDAHSILEPLSRIGALTYEADPRGIRRAREAVASYYADHGAEVDPDHIQLTTSTSEAYSFLFRLLCDPGDEVLVAQPSYPLFDFLADLDDVRLVPYPLFYDYGWHIDLHALAGRITPRTRAILLVHPNNPTGHFTALREREEIEALCLRHNLALIVDEVFLDYAFDSTSVGAAPDLASGHTASFTTGEHPALTFTLSGMSKIAGLPQMKAAWIVAQGPREALTETLTEALKRLEVIADTFLSMNAPVQHALPTWLANRHGIQRQIKARTLANLQRVREMGSGGPVDALHVQGGWNLVLRVAAVDDDTELSLRLLEQQGIIVHPGSFYGMARSGRLVVSLIVPEKEFETGMGRLGEANAQNKVQITEKEPN